MIKSHSNANEIEKEEVQEVRICLECELFFYQSEKGRKVGSLLITAKKVGKKT